MTSGRLQPGDDKSAAFLDQIGQAMYPFITELYPICRSITGSGFRETLRGIDRHISMENVLKFSGAPYKIVGFYPFGYDERQYCSPGFNLPAGCFMRSRHGHYSE
jgi:aminopeptidase-like protein